MKLKHFATFHMHILILSIFKRSKLPNSLRKYYICNICSFNNPSILEIWRRHLGKNHNSQAISNSPSH